MSAHTPGPWRVSEQCAQMIDIRHDNRAPGAISLTLAKVVARPTWQREAEANARLIAAAPSLLTAAKEALASMERIWGTEGADDDFIYDEMGSSLAAGYFSLRAAIAEATGGAA